MTKQCMHASHTDMCCELPYDLNRQLHAILFGPSAAYHDVKCVMMGVKPRIPTAPEVFMLSNRNRNAAVRTVDFRLAHIRHLNRQRLVSRTKRDAAMPMYIADAIAEDAFESDSLNMFEGAFN
jgi:hypothetical protein